jgi:hypothetical protein
MVINSTMKPNRGGGKYCTAMLLHGKITMCSAWRPRNITMLTEGQVKNKQKKELTTMNNLLH